MRNRRFFVLSLLILVFFGWCSAGWGGTPLHVFVSLAPQKEFVERLAGDRVKVTVLVPSGTDPHTFEPSPEHMKGLSQASLYFAIGFPFEKNLLSRIRSLNPHLKVVQTDQGLLKIPMHGHFHSEDQVTASHESHAGEKREETRQETSKHHAASHGHEAGEPDPHVWLSPPMVMNMARTMSLALMEADPEDRAGYEARYISFLMGVAALDLEISRIFLNAKPPRAFYVFHPSWGYFAEAYGLQQVAVEFEGKEAKPHHLKEIIASGKQAGVRTLFVQPQFSKKAAEMVAKEMGAKLEVIDPLAENWMDNLRQVSYRIREAMP
ncbi:MAG: zinc ABC transporter substrate-binding protein [Desulfosoma sp.]